ncbi:MAG TPA: Ig-like domain-containing protein [Candidatus Rifleibacterium sp.]|nr:Ig-like domain-containing protein [Candidatus Rifleibacterium sp.]
MRVIRQGFGDYSLVEWRDDESGLSLITSHNNSTGLKQSLLTNPGRLDLTLPLSGADYLITGYNAFKKCPMICRWNTSKTSSTEMQVVSNKNLEWDHYFTDEPYSSDPTQGQVVANLSIDAAGGISAYVKTPTGVIHPYTIARDSGQATANFTTEIALNQPPTVALLAPTEGTSSADNQSLDISAAPEDSDGSIKEVEFLANGEVIGKAVAEPWIFSWSGMNAGSYKLVARAWDNLGFAGLSSPVNVTITESGFGNQAPTVSLTAPAANATFSSASSVSIEATATDVDGSISKVEFYRGSSLIGSDDSAPYTMTWVQPAAGNYVLTARAYDDKNAKTDSSAVSITVTTTNAGTGPELMLSEIGSRLYSNVPFWIEFINKSTNAIQLSDYEIRTPAMPINGGTIAKSATFQLPTFNLAAGAYVIVRFNNNTDNFAGPQVVHANYSTTTLPYWSDWGIIDLRKTSTGKTIDFVKFGAIEAYYETTPDPATEWSGTAAPAMTKALGHSLARNLESNDNHTAANWATRAFQTPAAANDVISDTDADADGIPDENEAPGKTFCGLPYYDWGARAGTKDIFVHIDYMNPAACPDPLAVTPRGEALQKIQAAFARKAINIHFDTGTLLGSTVAQHCLDGRSHQVDYAETLYLTPELGTANAYVYKAASMPISKLPVFHYCLLGFKPARSFGGLGEVGGNDYIVTLGQSDVSQHFSTATTEKLNYLINSQASTIMHELGHNLGLLHGGNEDLNNKPNYFSIMNYMYSNNGLPTIGNSAEGDRYYYYRFEELNDQAFAQYFPSGWWEDIHNNAYSADMVLDFSDGNGADINESSISETAGLGRSGSAGVDFNGDGDKSDTGLSKQLVGTSGTLSTHRDFNDWDAISLKFTANGDGQASIRASVVDSSLQKADYLAFDRQKFVTCDPMSTHREH